MLPSHNARASVLEALYSVTEKGSQPKILFDKVEGLDRRDRAFAMELLFGVLRHQIKIDYVLRQFLRYPDTPLNPWILNILRIGIYQILFMDRVPESAAVNESVKLSYYFAPKNSGGFINGVLRNIVRKKQTLTCPSSKDNPINYISIETSHPQWLIKRWVTREGFEKALKRAQANNVLPTLVLRINSLRIDRESAMELLKKRGMNCKATRYSPDGIEVWGEGSFQELPEELKGLFQPQDEASQLMSIVLGPKPGQRVLDACAAPGVKTTHMAQLMNNRGEIFSVDRAYKRIKMLKDNIERFGIKIVTPLVDDITHAHIRGEFDHILIDAPCSALGVIRKNPDIKLKREESELMVFHHKQVQILESLKNYLKPGGVLLYCVCSTTEEETVMVINEFLKKNSNYIKEDIEEFSDLCHNGFLQTYPLEHNMDGFFGARLCRVF